MGHDPIQYLVGRVVIQFTAPVITMPRVFYIFSVKAINLLTVSYHWMGALFRLLLRDNIENTVVSVGLRRALSRWLNALRVGRGRLHMHGLGFNATSAVE